MNNTVGMDYLQEAIILGIDVIIFGLCLKGYHSHKNTIKALKVFDSFSFVHIDWKSNVLKCCCLFAFVCVFSGSSSVEHRQRTHRAFGSAK